MNLPGFTAESILSSSSSLRFAGGWRSALRGGFRTRAAMLRQLSADNDAGRPHLSQHLHRLLTLSLRSHERQNRLPRRLICLLSFLCSQP